MTPFRTVSTWIVGKFWAVAVVFTILWVLDSAATWFQDLQRTGKTVVELRSIEARVKDTADTGVREVRARVLALDTAAQETVEARVHVLRDEISQATGQLPSAAQRLHAVATGDTPLIADWATRALSIRLMQEEQRALEAIVEHRSRLAAYELALRDGPAALEQVRLAHVALLVEIQGLERQIVAERGANLLTHWVPRTPAYLAIEALSSRRQFLVRSTHELKAKHDALTQLQRQLRKPAHPGTALAELKVDVLLEELRSAGGRLEAELGQDWAWRILHFDFNPGDLLRSAVIIVAVVSLTPLGIKLVLFYVFAPMAGRRHAVALLPEESGQVFTAQEAGGPMAAMSSVSCRVAIDASDELLVHPEYLQSLPNACETRTQWLLDRRIPLSSLAAGLCALTRLRAETPQTVVVSSTRDPLSEVALITIPRGSSVVLLPRHIVGVLQGRSAPLRISRHWRLFSLHAWLTLQLRYLVFHGPVTLVVKGCRGVRVEAAEAGRSLSPAATLGFSANLRYASRRCETLFAYLSGQPLLNDSFAGGAGSYIYQEMPDTRRHGVFARGLEGVLDAVLKPLGI